MSKKGFNIIDFMVVLAIVVVLAAVLVPVIASTTDDRTSQCQANLSRIGKAIKMYLSDWEDIYPTNRQFIQRPGSTTVKLSTVKPIVKLSDPQLLDNDHEPVRFQYGINWVEALYPYVEKVCDEDPAKTWICPSARNIRGSGSGRFACVTYAFNGNLMELPEGLIKNAGSIMEIRELDRLYDSVLRPTNQTNTNVIQPNDPFLDAVEEGTKKARYSLHGTGSNILFADGHVKLFPSAYFPKTCQWDGEYKQWFNFTELPEEDPRSNSIAVSP